MRKTLHRIAILLLTFLACSCSIWDILPPDMGETKTVAVVAPIGNASVKARLERTAQWFLDSLSMDLALEWYDETSENMFELGERLSRREDLVAVIGPFDNEKLADFAQECKQTLKPLIAPTASSEDVVRRYAVQTAGNNKNLNHFFWALTGTDISLTELLLSHYGAYQEENKEYTRMSWPAFFAPNDLYGKTFSDWAPFFANQQDFPIKEYEVYEGTENLILHLREQMDRIYQDGFWQHLSGFCVLETPAQLLEVAAERRRWMLSNEMLQHMYEFPSTDPDDRANDAFQQVFIERYKTWFSLPDIPDKDLKSLGSRLHMLEGYQILSPYADPETGFAQHYEEAFGTRPTFAECKLCDALQLVTSAVRLLVLYQNWPKEMPVNERMNKCLGLMTPMTGPSGKISFDEETGMPTTRTTYLMWEVRNGKVEPLHYYRNGASEVMADWKKSYDERHASDDFDTQAGGSSDGEYAPLTGRYAVLVQGSTDFYNYRHAADVLSVYQLLRANGLDDEHIILIMDKSLAADPKNPAPGTIHRNVVEPDLYGGTEGIPAAVVDYDSADLSVADIADILLGKSSEQLSVTLPSGEGNNVLLYWSGHGNKATASRDAEFQWRRNPTGSGFSASLLQETVQSMTFRKLLVIAEPCYGEAILLPLKDIPHTLGLSGAAREEQSWADCWDPDYSFWMCDRFSRNLVDCLQNNRSATYRELFLYCSTHTLGSHPRIIPGRQFGNLYVNKLEEFIVNP